MSQVRLETLTSDIVAHVKEVVCHEFGINEQLLLAPIRRDKFVYRRWVGIYLAKKMAPWLSEPKIAKMFAHKDHTTVRHALKRMREKREADVGTDALLTRLEAVLQGAA